ncbi:hypothetical protein ACFC25_08500 [Pseudarthrobacter sp. NPDC055928]|uniref:MmyB family transcriptional regulator n=1 Tax=Pseudarthrobacter sp. NPDC055928 TaxID=3345661 RepID=UPI0035D981CE
MANDVVAILRNHAGRRPHDKSLTDLIGELATRSDEFRKRWPSTTSRFHRTGTKRLNHPVVGELELSDERLKLLASWAASPANELPCRLRTESA